MDWDERFCTPKKSASYWEEKKRCADAFKEIGIKYREDLRILREQLGESDAVKSFTHAMETTFSIDFFYSLWQGFKANLDSLQDPWDSVVFKAPSQRQLQMSPGRRLPEYLAAEKWIKDFYRQLTDEQRAVCDSIFEQKDRLMKATPILAHYYGYWLANILVNTIDPAGGWNMAFLHLSKQKESSY